MNGVGWFAIGGVEELLKDFLQKKNSLPENRSLLLITPSHRLLKWLENCRTSWINWIELNREEDKKEGRTILKNWTEKKWSEKQKKRETSESRSRKKINWAREVEEGSFWGAARWRLNYYNFIFDSSVFFQRFFSEQEGEEKDVEML